MYHRSNYGYNIDKTILTEPEKKRSVLFILRKDGKCTVIWYIVRSNKLVTASEGSVKEGKEVKQFHYRLGQAMRFPRV